MSQNVVVRGWFDTPDHNAEIGVSDRRASPEKSGASSQNDISRIIGLTEGTLIDTPHGPRQIETLIPGEMVTTQNGPRPLRRIGATEITSAELVQNPKLRPVRIVAGALGHDLPQTDLLVSQQHRLLVSSPTAKRMCDASDVLISAIRLTALPGIMIDNNIGEVAYIHVLFDDHQIIRANGAPTESLLAGAADIAKLTPEVQNQVLSLFPSLRGTPAKQKPAAIILPQAKQRALVKHHAGNSRIRLIAQR